MSSIAEVMGALQELGPKGLARFEASLEPAWIDEALTASGKASIRRRKFPAEQAIWLVLGMALFEDRSIAAVVSPLELALPRGGAVASSAISNARGRLGPEPIEYLFRKVAAAWAKISRTRWLAGPLSARRRWNAPPRAGHDCRERDSSAGRETSTVKAAIRSCGSRR